MSHGVCLYKYDPRDVDMRPIIFIGTNDCIVEIGLQINQSCN